MKTCKKGHREITYDEKKIDNPGIYSSCPMCDLLKQIEITGNILNELKKRYYEAADLNK